MSMDVVDECPNEAKEPDTPGPSRPTHLSVVGHGHIDAIDEAREPGPLVTAAERERRTRSLVTVLPPRWLVRASGQPNRTWRRRGGEDLRPW